MAEVDREQSAARDATGPEDAANAGEATDAGAARDGKEIATPVVATPSTWPDQGEQAARSVWLRPEARVARSILVAHYGSGWMTCEVLLAVALAILMFWSADDARYVFTSASVGLGLLSIVFAALLAHGALRPEAREPLARAYGPAAFIRGLLLAAGVVQVGICVLIVGLALSFGRILDASPGKVVAGTVGLAATCVLLAALAVTVSSPLTTRDERLVLLALLDGALYSLMGGGWLADALTVARLPLLPIIACYEVTIAGELSWGWLGALLLAGACVAGLGWVAERLLARAAAKGVKSAARTTGA